jgi:hypothetical protein
MKRPAFALVRSGQGRDRTADLPLFRFKDHGLRWVAAFFPPAQGLAINHDRPRCTWIYETRNETAQTCSLILARYGQSPCSRPWSRVDRQGGQPPIYPSVAARKPGRGHLAGARILARRRPGASTSWHAWSRRSDRCMELATRRPQNVTGRRDEPARIAAAPRRDAHDGPWAARADQGGRRWGSEHAVMAPLCQENGCSRLVSVRRSSPPSSRLRLTAAAVRCR